MTNTPWVFVSVFRNLNTATSNREETELGYSIEIFGESDRRICIRPELLFNVSFRAKYEMLWTKTLKMKEIVIFNILLFVGHMYGKHDWTGWKAVHTLQHHVHLKPQGPRLKDVVAMPYGSSATEVTKQKGWHLFVSGGDDQRSRGATERAGNNGILMTTLKYLRMEAKNALLLDSIWQLQL